MFRRTLTIAVSLLALAGCAAAPPVSLAPLPWQDAAFGYSDALVTVGRDELFRLDPQLHAQLRAPEVTRLPAPARFKHLMALIYGPDRQRFGYVAGHSTTAAQTWQNQRGDCLSLTVLTYAAARAVDLAAHMQEVQAPALFDRRGRLDVVNQHVNAVIHRAYRDLRDSEARDVVVDFEPDYASRRPGRTLTEDGVVARYYNNIATEHLARGEREKAYAHFKAAILADPGFSASYGNLAVLYKQAGLVAQAEQLLRRAIDLGDTADVPLHALHELFLEQGRMVEAQGLERALRSGRERDPYHWIGLGLQHLKDNEVRQAIGALEQARELANGFDEVHRYLAVAYWRAGERAKARDELTMLASLTGDEAGVAKLRSKIKGGKY